MKKKQIEEIKQVEVKIPDSFNRDTKAPTLEEILEEVVLAIREHGPQCRVHDIIDAWDEVGDGVINLAYKIFREETDEEFDARKLALEKRRTTTRENELRRLEYLKQKYPDKGQ